MQVFASRCRALRWDEHPDAISVLGTHTCVHTWGCRAETLAKKTPKPQGDCSCLLSPKGSAPLLLPAAMHADFCRSKVRGY